MAYFVNIRDFSFASVSIMLYILFNIQYTQTSIRFWLIFIYSIYIYLMYIFFCFSVQIKLVVSFTNRTTFCWLKLAAFFESSSLCLYIYIYSIYILYIFYVFLVFSFCFVSKMQHIITAIEFAYIFVCYY